MDNIRSYELFKYQKNRLIEALVAHDPEVKIRMNWKDLSTKNIKRKQNWSFWFYPKNWEISSRQFSGVHIGIIYLFDKAENKEYVRLSVGVESPVTDQYKKQFKDEVIRQVDRQKINLSGFDLWPDAGVTNKKVKLLEVKFPLNKNSWIEAMNYFKKLDAFNSIVSDKIAEFKKKGFFK